MNGNVIVLLCICTFGALCAAALPSEKPSYQLQPDDLNITNPLKLKGKPKAAIPSKLPQSGSSCSCKGEKYGANTANSDFQYYILKGKSTRPHAYPSVVSLFHHSRPVCGGTIINRCFILTAAHCVTPDLIYSNYKVVIGLHNVLAALYDDKKTNGYINSITDKNFKKVKVTRITIGDYNPSTHENDIAILELAEPIIYNADVQPVRLPSVARNYANTKGTAVGWGITAECVQPRLLQEATLPIIPLNVCQNLAGRSVVLNKKICTADQVHKKSIYRGDSGGPLFVNGEQVGITSWGTGNHEEQIVSAFTNVYDYMATIKYAIGPNCRIHTRP